MDDDPCNEKQKYFNVLNRIQKKFSTYECILLMKRQYLTNNTFYYFLCLLFRFFYLIYISGNINKFEQKNKKTLLINSYIKKLTCLNLVQHYNISFIIYISIIIIIIVLLLLRLIMYYYIIKEFHENDLSNKWILPNKYLIIIEHIVFLFFPYMIEFFSLPYYILFFHNNFIPSINTNNKNYIVNLNTKNNDNDKNKLKSYNLNFIHYDVHPQSNFNSAEFIIINSIGEGSFGKIYCVQWIKNNKLYAMKKLDIQTIEELNEFKSKVKIVDDLYKKTNHIGFVKLYADKVVILYNQPICYNYYIIMELGDRDWEKEIQIRLLHQKYYTEYELYQIIYQLVKTLSIMQQNNVTHRDIKPANVLIMNGIYKICDFGEASIINGNGVVIQSVRGSQLFMSPILFYAYNHNVPQVMHNTYKSDVYSFGMCILLAATLSGYTLYDIREILDIQQVSKIIINKLSSRYSINFINLLLQMLQIDENLRMDFIHLENYIRSFYKF